MAHEDHDGMEERLVEHLNRIRREVKANGYSFEFILSDDETPPYIYTIGLSMNFGHPEIYLAGLPPEVARDLVDELVDRIKRGERFDQPGYVEDLIHFDMPIRPMTPETIRDNAGTGWEILGGRFDAVQLFYPDRDGYAPWEEECDPDYAAQLCFELSGGEPARTRPIRETPAYATPDGKRPTDEQIAENRRRIIAERREMIAEHGWVPQAVGGSEDQPGFTYTIGLSKTWNHPELFVVALNPEQAFHVVASLVERVEAGERFDTPAFVDEVLTIPVSVRPLEQKSVDQNSGLGQEMLGRQLPAVQVYWPDMAGIMPWEDGCDPSVASAQLAIFTPTGNAPERTGAPPLTSLH
jgi:hypothetical protein